MQYFVWRALSANPKLDRTDKKYDVAKIEIYSYTFQMESFILKKHKMNLILQVSEFTQKQV